VTDASAQGKEEDFIRIRSARQPLTSHRRCAGSVVN
jgi:hypothetical protein